MIQNYLFIASTGKNDLKFLITENGENKLAEIMAGKKHDPYVGLRLIHEKLLNNDIPHIFQNLPDIQTKKEKIYFKQSDDGTTLNPKLGDNQQVQKTNDDKYILCAAKLQGLITSLKNKITNNEIRIIGALFVGTERRNQAMEPIASHRLLAKHFAEQLNMNYVGELPEDVTIAPSDCPVYWLNQLKDLPDRDGNHYDGLGLDYPVKRIVAKRIDDSIHQFVNYFANTSPEIIVSDTGGMNDLKDLLSASIHFRAYSDVLESPQTEKNDTFDTRALDRLISEKHLITRRQSLQIKTLVKHRILEGDIYGAWSTCVHIHDEEQLVKHDTWSHAVQAVKNYFSGEYNFKTTRFPNGNNYTELSRTLSELTKGETLEEQIQRLLTRTLFTIESNLQSSRPEEMQIKNALVSCATLSDQLFRACIFLYLEKNRSNFPNLKPNLQFSNDEVLTVNHTNNNDKHFTNKKINPFYGKNEWRGTLKNDVQLSLCIHYQNRMSCGKNNKHPAEQWKLQEWRNSIAHGRNINETDLKHILNKACQTTSCINQTDMPDTVDPLWNSDLTKAKPPTLGSCFLNQHYVHLIEKSLGYDINSTQQKYQKLQNNLLAIINSSIYIAE